MIETQNLTVNLAGKTAVEGVSTRFAKSSLTALVGPNGAGKTSLLKAMVGLLPFSGTVLCDGASLPELSAQKRAKTLSYLPQGQHAYWPLACKTIIALGLYPLGATNPDTLTPEQSRAVGDAMLQTGTTDFAERPFTSLSGGERARVALARVLVGQSPVLLVDEPTASLDPHYQLELFALLKRLAEQGKTVIMVTHDLTSAMRFADDVKLMKQGQLLAEGAPFTALNEASLKEAFAVAPLRFSHEGQEVMVPWRAL